MESLENADADEVSKQVAANDAAYESPKLKPMMPQPVVQTLQ